jgi:HlyD family secretion protein
MINNVMKPDGCIGNPRPGARETWRSARLRGVAALACGALVACDVALAKEGPEPYQGTVELDEWVLAFEVPGRVQSVEVHEGDWVQPGAPLAALDPALATQAKSAREREADAARAQVSVVEAGSRKEEIRSAEAQVRAARATENLLGSNLTRERTLKERGASTAEVVDEIQGRLDRAVAERQALEERLAALRKGARSEEVEAARARAVATEAAVALERERIARHAIAAPTAGLVLDVHVKAGEVVLAGAPVVTLGDVRRPYADVFVPQADVSGIQAGGAAQVRVDAEPEPFPARIETIARRTEFTPRYLFSERERANLVVRVRVRIEDPEGRLKAGVPTFVTIGRGLVAIAPSAATNNPSSPAPATPTPPAKTTGSP